MLQSRTSYGSAVIAAVFALTGILAHNYGEQAATGFIHDFQGLITFFLAFVVLLVEAKLLTLFGPSFSLRAAMAGRTTR